MDTNEILVKIEPKYELGKKMLKILDRDNTLVFAFLWFYIPETNIWKLLIGSSKLQQLDMRNNYIDFYRKYKENNVAKEIGLENIIIIDKSSPLLQVLKSVVQTSSTDVNNMRITSCVFNGVVIEDALIYRMS